MKKTSLAVLLGGLLLAGGIHATAAEHVHASQAWIRVLPGSLPAGARSRMPWAGICSESTMVMRLMAVSLEL